ncbi:MAG: hypothetical protein GX033_01935 [Firmicutes bacterium]|nr:hypothetical protein [Bacillota bacterium]
MVFRVKPEFSVIMINLVVLPLSVMAMPVQFADQDGKCDWDKRAIAMPVTKRDIVASRYAACLIVTLLEFVFVIGINILIVVARGGDLRHNFLLAVLGLAISVVLIGVSALSNYLSVTSGAVVLLITILLYILGLLIGNKIEIDWNAIFRLPPHWFVVMALAVALALYFLTFIVSTAIYARKHR